MIDFRIVSVSVFIAQNIPQDEYNEWIMVSRSPVIVSHSVNRIINIDEKEIDTKQSVLELANTI